MCDLIFEHGFKKVLIFQFEMENPLFEIHIWAFKIVIFYFIFDFDKLF